MNVSNTFGERLRRFRKERGYSCEQLADKAKSEEYERPVSASLIRELEAGRRKDIPLSVLLQLSKLLKVWPVCLAVNHRDPFGKSDLPGLSTRLCNDEVSELFSVPVFYDDPELAATEEIRFSFHVNRHLRDLVRSWRRLGGTKDQFQDFAAGIGAYSAAFESFEASVDLPDSEYKRLEQQAYAFFANQGMRLRNRIRRLIRRIARIERAHGCWEDSMFEKAAGLYLTDTEWIDRASDTLKQAGWDGTPDVAYDLLRFNVANSKKDVQNPYMWITAVRQELTRFNHMGQGKDYLVAVGLYFAAAQALLEIERDDVDFGIAAQYQDMDERFSEVRRIYNLPTFGVINSY